MSDLTHLFGFINDTTPTTKTDLPLPKLPPRRRGEEPREIGSPADQATAAERRAVAVVTAKASSNGYPFLSKRAIKAKLQDPAEDQFRRDVIVTIYSRQTEDEIATKDTKWKNRVGFMSSHAVNGTRIAEKILGTYTPSKEGDTAEWTAKDEEHLRKIAPSYSRQMASHLAQKAMRENPELVKIAAKFGVTLL